MKKVMIGILILIPIIVLVVVALVSVIVSVNAHIAVEDLQLRYKDSDKTIYTLQIPFDEVANINIYNYVDAKVYPEKATNKTVEWQIVGDVSYTDENYEASRNAYLANLSSLKAELENELANGSFSTPARQNAYNVVKSKYYKDSSLIISEMADILLEKVYPAAAFVDENGKEIESNTTGKMLVSSYCKFTVRAQAETVSRIITVSVMGYDVERVTLGVSEEEDTTLGVGESMRLLATYTPIDSIVNTTIWSSSDESVISVDQNGVVTALKEGRATISLLASVYSSEKKDELDFVEGTIDLTVEQKGASSIFGEKVVTSRTSLTFAELGVVKEEIASVEGGLLTEDGITVNADIAQITTKDGRRLTLTKCAQSDIAIRNTRFYSSESGYVLAVGENVLDLDLVWADMLEESAPQKAIWTSSDSSVATVGENGEVRGVSRGIVTITATVGAKSVSVTINVQNKLSQIQLRTSNASLAIGIARETVFASEKYVNVGVNNDKVANSTLITVQGQPEGATAAQLAAFYSAYVFEIVSGAQYARFDDEVANKLIFLPTLEGVGKQSIVVRVSARYPKYEGFTKFTTEEVTIKAVFGVECSNIAEARQATKDQREYAHKDGNLQSRKNVFEKEIAGVGYAVYDAPRSRNLYAICLADNIVYEVNEDGTPVTVNGSNNLNLYGDLYGNNHIISALKQQVETHLIRINWSGVTLSNTVMRSNSIGDDGLITDAEDTEGFTSTVCEVICGYDWDTNRLNDVCIEYCIFENAKQAITLFNVDATVNGCIIRNMTQVGMYIPQRMADMGDAVYPFYSHLNINNVVCSNMLGSLMSVAYEKFTMKSSKLGRFADDFDENEKIFLEEFYSAGVNCVINQTGFLEAYNWQNIKNAGLLKTGNADVDGMIGSMVYDLIRENSAFDNYKYEYGGETYMHVAFICSGISFKDGIMNAPTYLQYNSQNANYSCINTADIKSEGGSTASLAATVLSRMSLRIYGYTNDASITPASTYQVNSALIERIHS